MPTCPEGTVGDPQFLPVLYTSEALQAWEEVCVGVSL